MREIVAGKLVLDWSPEQISGWLKTQYPDDKSMRVSHETIYRSLFIQARGVLKQELMEHLRSKRRMRRSLHSTVLVKVPSKDTETVAAALSKHVRKLPATLRRSLTWDRGTRWPNIRASPWPPMCRSSSVIRKAPGSEEPTKIPTGY